MPNGKGKCLMALAIGWLAWGASAAGVEGKWTPDQVLELDPAWLRSLGLQIQPEQLWSTQQGAGLLEAAVKINGCSASFISAQGLMITNHHCAFSILQQHSTPERDLITGGFLAARHQDELPGSNVRATLPHTTTDVSQLVEAAAAAAGADDLARYRAIDRKKKDLVAECERQKNRRCEVAAFDGGVRYVLSESIEYPDVRLVYAPPRAVGDFGGEIDNWSWPRHSGDFALLRVYAAPDGAPAPYAQANRPLAPAHFFPVAAQGAAPGDFVMVPGYPGVTFRSLTAAEVRERAVRFYPHLSQVTRTWLDLEEAAARTNATARIALADRIKSLSNTEKNSRGQIDGLRRGNILAKKEAAERVVLDWAAARPQDPLASAGAAAHGELTRLVELRNATWDRNFLLNVLRSGPKPLDLAITVVRHARETLKPDLEREAAFMDRNRDRFEEGLRRDQSRIYPPVEAQLLADLLARFAAMPEPARVPAVEAVLAGLPPAATTATTAATEIDGTAAGSPPPRFDAVALQARAAQLIAGSRVGDLAERMKMLVETEPQLLARHDPLLDLAAGLATATQQDEEEDHRFGGAVSRLRPAWRKAVAAQAGKPLAPDANGTLRVSFAHVQGYSPRDGVWMTPQTRLAGMVEKSTGEEPFDTPPAILTAAAQGPSSPWADPALHDVPVCFLADADTTGGNSGSPVLNGRGQLVGVNFDRVWENVANDFGFNPDVARNISVDIRYLLWMLTATHGDAAQPLLDEMGVAHPAKP
jgi:Peptidase S46